MELNSDQIAQLLPHRYPFALVDRILDCEPGQWAKGRKCVSVGEPYFCGHFPQENRGKLALFGGIKNARFKRKVVPGDVLEMECVLTKRRGPVGIGECKALVDGQVACVAELTFAITDAAR